MCVCCFPTHEKTQTLEPELNRMYMPFNPNYTKKHPKHNSPQHKNTL
jgi:hypothetical protein